MVLLGYWKIRGLKTPINYCLEYAKEEYSEKLFELVKDDQGEYNFSTSYSDSEWGKEIKPKSPCDFPNLPYLIDGDTKITQMLAIMAHVCRKNKVLLPNTDAEATQMDMLNGVIGDWRSNFVRVCYSPSGNLDDYTKGDDTIMARKLPGWLVKFEKFFENNSYCAGQNLTYADFNLFELLDAHLELIPGCFKNSPNLEAYHQKIASIPQIKEYRDSDRFFARPLNNASAKYK